MKSIRVSNIDEFDAQIKSAVETGNPVFALFFGTDEPETSESWCPDCVIADPLVRKAVLQVKDSILVEAAVGGRSEWKGNAANPYRVRYNVPAIPTLFKWSTAGPGDSLVEDDCADYEKLIKFVEN
ncbi:thioredoxin fold domain-containing protein [Pilaira anomala]|nr:thioredoxin fold domain-containing protein [Pilaira anomala]